MQSRYPPSQVRAIAEEFDLPQKSLERCARVREAGSVLRLKPRGLQWGSEIDSSSSDVRCWANLPVVRYLNRSDVAHQAIRIWLEHFGSSIYEYLSKTGQWPSQSAT